MKNIHVLPTDKPSRLCINGKNGQHIYITSDEEIKEGDRYINPRINKVLKCDHTNISVVNLFGCKKIILSTDQDLIKNGVQAIDDEFLEWFVKNPSCDYVEVKRNKKLSNKSIWDAVEGDLVFNNYNCGGIITQLSNDIRVHIISENGEGYVETAITSDNGLDTLVINNYKVYEYSDYKIIIPKEEPKQEWTPTQGEQVWIKVFSNWSKGTYIGYDTTKSVHLVREDKEGGGNLLSSSKILPYKSMPNEPRQETINLDKLESQLDDALEKETKESLTNWLHSKRNEQETLEEAAETNSEKHHYAFRQQSEFYQLGFIEGAKWQAKKMYSEEEVFRIIA